MWTFQLVREVSTQPEFMGSDNTTLPLYRGGALPTGSGGGTRSTVFRGVHPRTKSPEIQDIRTSPVHRRSPTSTQVGVTIEVKDQGSPPFPSAIWMAWESGFWSNFGPFCRRPCAAVRPHPPTQRRWLLRRMIHGLLLTNERWPAFATSRPGSIVPAL